MPNKEQNTEDEQWLEDSRLGRFKRVATLPEESMWICYSCGEEHVDPYDVGCENCGAEPDM